MYDVLVITELFNWWLWGWSRLCCCG